LVASETAREGVVAAFDGEKSTAFCVATAFIVETVSCAALIDAASGSVPVRTTGVHGTPAARKEGTPSAELTVKAVGDGVEHTV
jgi:hypothetical protein